MFYKLSLKSSVTVTDDDVVITSLFHQISIYIMIPTEFFEIMCLFLLRFMNEYGKIEIRNYFDIENYECDNKTTSISHI